MSHDHHPISAGTPPTNDADYSRSEPAHLHLSVRDYLVIFGLLMILLIVTVLAAFLPHFGYLNIVIAMGIAMIKAVLVVLFFMHVKFSSRVTMIFVCSSALWLGILFALTWQEYVAREWEPVSRGWNENPVLVEERVGSKRLAESGHTPAAPHE